MFSITLCSISTGRRCLVVHGIDERSRLYTERCAWDACPCTDCCVDLAGSVSDLSSHLSFDAIRLRKGGA